MKLTSKLLLGALAFIASAFLLSRQTDPAVLKARVNHLEKRMESLEQKSVTWNQTKPIVKGPIKLNLSIHKRSNENTSPETAGVSGAKAAQP